jgi:myo-inositol 2-dehydrogenase/D-chiro-inositol 1-dehydrogenase
MTMKTVNVGIIGAGRMGNVHAKELAQLEGVKIAGVYDIKPDAADGVKKGKGVLAVGGVTIYTN